MLSNISVKKYNEINKYNNLEIEIKKILIVGTLGMIKKKTDKHFNKMDQQSQPMWNTKKLNFVGLLISLRESNQCDWKISAKK